MARMKDNKMVKKKVGRDHKKEGCKESKRMISVVVLLLLSDHKHARTPKQGRERRTRGPQKSRPIRGLWVLLQSAPRRAKQQNTTPKTKRSKHKAKERGARLSFPPIFANIADATNATNERRRSVPFVQSSFRLTLTAHTLPSFSQDADELVKGETKKALLLLPSLHLRGTNTQSSSVFFSSSPPSKTKAPPHFLLRSA